ncbi:hypothetical protein EGT07_32820 [Herbaspirillum sp. HC18]|nr:hypothetical protein EGT07_32820 [Herbaspirillum sp. HC18]
MKRTQKKPSHAVYVVEGEGDNAFWTKIGAAWEHQDGKGLNITLSALPLNGRLVIRDPKVDEDEE